MNPRSPAPNNQAGNLDVNDVYLRSMGQGQWLSQGAGSAYGVIWRSARLTFAATRTWYNVPLTLEQVKAGVVHSNTANPERVSVSRPGIYLVFYSVNFFNIGSGGTGHSRLLLNGAEVGGTAASTAVEGVTLSGICSAMTILQMNAGDTVSIQAGKNAGGVVLDTAAYPAYGAPAPDRRSCASLTVVKLQ